MIQESNAMFELTHAIGNTYYIESPAKIGLF